MRLPILYADENMLKIKFEASESKNTHIDLGKMHKCNDSEQTKTSPIVQFEKKRLLEQKSVDIIRFL